VRRDKTAGLAENAPMDLERFRTSLADGTPPAGTAGALQALWHEAKGDWARAHDIVQSLKGADAAAVHAYLHRREGELANADYWYAKAGRRRPRGSLDREWQALAMELLEKRSGKQ
jgi:hypothetical protein